MRSVRRIVITLLVLAGLLVAVDRVAAWAAGEMVATRVDDEMASYNVSAESSEADVAGVPFLTQVVSGEYQEVTLWLRDVGSASVRLPEVRLTATGVTAPTSAVINGTGQIRAERVVGAAVIGYGTIAEQAGVDGLELSAANSGDGVAVRLPVELLGTQVTLAGTASVRAVDDAIRVRVEELTAEELPPGSASEVERLVQQLSFDYLLPVLPYGLTVESVRTRPAGVEITMSAVDVPLSR